MNYEHRLIRFYQQANAQPTFAILYRIKDSFDNEKTLAVSFEVKGLSLYMKYRLYGLWVDSGTPNALSNLHCTIDFPKETSQPITEDLERKLLNLTPMDDYHYDSTDFQVSIGFYDALFDNAITKIESILGEQTNLLRKDLGGIKYFAR